MKPIPTEAMPVVEVLRRDVPRPKTLPIFLSEDDPRPALRWLRNELATCPMGLHRKSWSPTPLSGAVFADNCCTGEQVCAFYLWWDVLPVKHAEEAVSAIWGEE